MQKTVYIHIGSHKTGTTAIQFFLSKNREKLRSRGILYPGKDVAHHDMAKELITLPFSSLTEESTATSAVLREISGPGPDKVVLSSEGFECAGQQAETLKKILPEGCDVRIIFYLRRQDDKIESVYNASVKNPKFRSTATFSEFMSDATGNGRVGLKRCCIEFGDLDYYAALLPWSRAFGRENIIIRCYEKEQLPDGIFSDFLAAAKISPDEAYEIPKERVNTGLNWDLIEMIRLCNRKFRTDLQFHQFLVKNLAGVYRDQAEAKQRLLSPRQRLDIIARYDESNAKIAREYLNRPDGRLFLASLPDDSEPWKPFEGLTIETLIPVFTQMMIQLEKRTQGRKAPQNPVKAAGNAVNPGMKGRVRGFLHRAGTFLGILPGRQE